MSRKDIMPRARIAGVLLLASLGANCSSDVTPVGPTTPTASNSPFVLEMVPASELESSVVFVSLPPDSFPGGISAHLQDPHTGSAATVMMIDGGFDPVAIHAAVGDTLTVAVHQIGGDVSFVIVVPPPHPPRVVRTDPPPSKRDVPLNASLAVVFSGPVDPAALTGTAIQLFDGSTVISAQLQFADDGHTTIVAVPTNPLAPNRTYQLVVGTTIRNLAGDELATPLTVTFTTGASTVGRQPVSLTLTPQLDSLPFVGAPVRLMAVLRDSIGEILVPSTPFHWSSTSPAIVSVSDTSTSSSILVGTPYQVVTTPGITYAFGDTGTVDISVSVGNFTARTTIRMRVAPGSYVALTPANVVIPAGGRQQLVAQFQNPNLPGPTGGALDAALFGGSVTWSSSAPLVAAIDNAGMVSASNAGTTTITATYRGRSGSTVITVTNPPADLGNFVAVDSLTIPHGGKITATLLPDGTALVTDGQNAEVFDPNTRKFAVVGSRRLSGWPFVTPLANGRVLFVSGDGAELYDPPTRSFIPTGAPPPATYGSAFAAAVTLPSGKVLVLNGEIETDDSMGPMPRASLYDPVSGTFTQAARYATAWDTTSTGWGLSVASATLLRNGKVLVSGYPQSELYDPATDSFTLIASSIRADATITRADGQVLFIGDVQDGYRPSILSPQLFDPVTNTFTSTGAPQLERNDGTATQLRSGNVLLAGGQISTCTGCRSIISNTAELYNPETGASTLIAPSLVPRMGQAAVALNDGSVLIVGGQVAAFAVPLQLTPTPTAELFIPSAAQFRAPLRPR